MRKWTIWTAVSVGLVLGCGVFGRHIIWNWLVIVADSPTILGKPRPAVLLYRASECFAIGSPTDLSRSLFGRSVALREAGAYAEAEIVLRQRLQLAGDTYGPESKEYVSAVVSLAGMLYCPGVNAGRLIPTLSHALAICDAHAYQLSGIRLQKSLVIAYYLTGDYAKSDEMQERYLTTCQEAHDTLDPPGAPYMALAYIYRRAGDKPAAEGVRQHLLQHAPTVRLLMESERIYWRVP